MRNWQNFSWPLGVKLQTTTTVVVVCNFIPSWTFWRAASNQPAQCWCLITWCKAHFEELQLQRNQPIIAVLDFSSVFITFWRARGIYISVEKYKRLISWRKKHTLHFPHNTAGTTLVFETQQTEMTPNWTKHEEIEIIAYFPHCSQTIADQIFASILITKFVPKEVQLLQYYYSHAA